MDIATISLIGIFITVVLYIFFIMRGINVYLLSASAAALVGAFSSMDIISLLLGPFMTSFISFIKSYFLLIVASALYGRFVADSGIAYSLGKTLADLAKRSTNHKIFFAALTLPLLNAMLTYSGVMLYVTSFTLMYIGRDLFKELDIPWHFYGFAIIGSATFTMGMLPGSPQVQNLLPMKFFGTTPMAAPLLGTVMAVMMVILALIYVRYAINKGMKNNEHYIDTAEGIEAYIAASGGALQQDRPVHPMWKCIIPLLVPVITMNVFKLNPIVAILLAIIVVYLLFRSEFTNLSKSINEGTINGFTPVLAISSAVGFGGAIAVVPGFKLLLAALAAMPGSPLMHLVVAIAVPSAITGSSSAGQMIGLNTVVAEYGPLIDPEVAHRISASASFASLMPHNGGVFSVATIIRIKISQIYKHYFMLGLLIPGIVCILGVLLAEMGLK